MTTKKDGRGILAALISGFLYIVNPISCQASEKLLVVPLVDETQLVLTPETLGIIANLNDLDSVKLAERYSAIRGIPRSNIIGIQLPRANFVTGNAFKRELDKLKALPIYKKLVGFALAFDRPYRIDQNQSITSAVAQGVASIKWQGSCNVTIDNPDQDARPGDVLKAKPAMLLSGGDGLESSIKLAERGKLSDASDPAAEVFFVKTHDQSRSKPREASMDRALARFGSEIGVSVTTADTFSNMASITGFQTGLPVLSGLDTLGFLPGAYADHLTSYGGALRDNKNQTTIAALIQAGATGSFGSVREPCNFPAKFPDPERLLLNYLRGDSLLESYWKSISMTTEGLLMGEPLARPFPILDAQWEKNGSLTLRANRHTLAYFSEAGRPANETAGAAAVSRSSYSVGIYAVENGRPQRLKNIAVPIDVRPGEVIDVFQLDAKGIAQRILGVLAN